MGRKRLTVLVAGLATAAVLGVSGVAFAVFSSTVSTYTTGRAGSMKPLTVVAGDKHHPNPAIVFANNERRLWPNVNNAHIAIVTIKVNNPNEVPVLVTSADITGRAVFDDGATQVACGEYLGVTETTELVHGDALIGPGKDAELTVKGVVLSENTIDECQNWKFHTFWDILGKAQ